MAASPLRPWRGSPPPCATVPGGLGPPGIPPVVGAVPHRATAHAHMPRAFFLHDSDDATTVDGEEDKERSSGTTATMRTTSCPGSIQLPREAAASFPTQRRCCEALAADTDEGRDNLLSVDLRPFEERGEPHASATRYSWRGSRPCLRAQSPWRACRRQRHQTIDSEALRTAFAAADGASTVRAGPDRGHRSLSLWVDSVGLLVSRGRGGMGMEGNGELKVDVSCVFKCNKCANSDSMLHEMMCTVTAIVGTGHGPPTPRSDSSTGSSAGWRCCLPCPSQAPWTPRRSLRGSLQGLARFLVPALVGCNQLLLLLLNGPQLVAHVALLLQHALALQGSRSIFRLLDSTSMVFLLSVAS